MPGTAAPAAALLAAAAMSFVQAAHAAPRVFAGDEDVARLVRLHRRQGESPQGAAIIIALIIVGVVALVIGLTFVWLRGNKKRQAWCRKNFCCCLPPPKEIPDDAPVYNGYGERIDPTAKVELPQWQVEQQAAGKMSAAEAIALMEQQAKQGQVQGANLAFEVPSVQALQQTTGYHAEELRGTKVAADLGLEEAAAKASAAVPEAVEDASAAVAGAAGQGTKIASDAVNQGAQAVTDAANQGVQAVNNAVNQGADVVTQAAATVTK
ncbi:hypothetical protein DFJ74DRAFT_376874 [Hyaloraphidium curvatum]|nr:hypothetical protein DFJ74DRAFT_376874 [Hyaloraphidium curvatum]